jgi:hypothetical protein
MAGQLKLDEDGMVMEGPFEGLYLRPLLAAFRQSAWDWPETVGALGLGEMVNGDTMYPGPSELAALERIAPYCKWTIDDLNFDT